MNSLKKKCLLKTVFFHYNYYPSLPDFRDSKDNPIVTRVGDEVLFGGRIDISKPVKILTHGYYSGRNKFFANTIREGAN